MSPIAQPLSDAPPPREQIGAGPSGRSAIRIIAFEMGRGGRRLPGACKPAAVA
jgi:hypothetical protein